MTIDKHLGRSADGTKNATYVTPNQIDKSLLVAVPRIENRELYGIDENNLPFVGYDFWNCYEFSCLTLQGFPKTTILAITYDASSPNIVESKSLKLYLNSYNNVKCSDPYKTIQSDLEEIIGAKVSVDSHWPCISSSSPMMRFSEYWPDSVLTTFELSEKETPDVLQACDVTNFARKFGFLRSNCKITNQPDWGTVFVSMIGRCTPTNHSIAQYIMSFRNENHFHEECCEMIYARLKAKFQPDELFVACQYTRRGGIDINSYRASNPTLLRILHDRAHFERTGNQ